MDSVAHIAPRGNLVDGRWASRFRALWSAAGAGYLGDQVTRLALPLFAASVADSPLPVSGVALALTVPWLLVGLPAGAVVDRLDRRRVLLGANALRLLAVVPLVIAAALGAVTLPLLYGCALALGVGDTLAETATNVLVPAIVPDERLEGANARLYGARTAIEIVALPLGGALAAVGLALAAGAGAASFAVALAAIVALPGRFRPDQPRSRPVAAEVGEGLRFLWDHALLRTIAAMAAVINACWSAWGALFVLHAVAPGPMGLSPFGYGLLLTAGGVGGLLGTAGAGLVQRRLGRRWAIGINVAVNAVMFAATALTANPWLVAPAIVLGDLGGPLWGIAVLSLQARIVPDALRGRVGSAYRFVSFGAMALGAFVGGLAAEAVGVRAVFAACALLTGAMLVPFVQVVTEASMRGER